MSSFTTLLKVSPLPDGRTWLVQEEFDYHLGAEDSPKFIHVPAGFETDFASTDYLQYVAIILTIVYGALAFFVNVPDWLGAIFMAVVLAALLITPYGKPSKAAVLHDWLYHCKIYTRKQSDQIFREAMLVCGAACWKVTAMYWAVRVFGFVSWA